MVGTEELINGSCFDYRHPGAFDDMQTRLYGPLQGRELSHKQEQRGPLNHRAVSGRSKAASLLLAGVTSQAVFFSFLFFF